MKPANKLTAAKNAILGLIAGVLLTIFIVGLVLPKLPSSGMLKDSFWANKIDNKGQYDIVVVGDSRVYRGINPSVISQKLNVSVFNYGFSSAGLDTTLLGNAIRLLDPAGKKILLIGITPASFTDESLKNEHFHSLMRINKKDLWIQKHLYPKLTFFDNYSLADLKKMSQGENYFQTFNSNGFVYSDKTPSDSFNALKPYIEFLKMSKVNIKAESDFLDLINQLHIKGYTCYGFRIPIAKPIEILENSVFNFDLFKIDFNNANGHWFSLPTSGFNSYDGSHLDGRTANKLSVILSDSLALLK